MPDRPSFEAREFFTVLPPIAGSTGTLPAVVALSASGTQVTIDLTTIPGSYVYNALDVSNDAYNPNPLGRYLFMQADGGDIYFAFGPTVASLTGGNALSTSAVSTVASNAVTLVAGGCALLKNGLPPIRFRLPGDFGTRDNADKGKNSLARYLGFLTATGTSTLRIYQVGP